MFAFVREIAMQGTSGNARTIEMKIIRLCADFDVLFSKDVLYNIKESSYEILIYFTDDVLLIINIKNLIITTIENEI